MALAWATFYTSSAQLAAKTIETHLLHLALHINLTTGETQNQLIALKCRFLQLSSVIARDRLDFVKAFNDSNEAIVLAYRLQSAELMASALFRHAKVFVEQQRYDLAVRDLEDALPYAARSRDPLRCYVSMFLAEVYSHLGSANEMFFQKALNHLDEVDRTVSARDVFEDDGSFTKVNVAGLYMVRSDVLRRSGAFKEAQGTLQVVQRSLPKELTRWQGSFTFSESQLFLASNDIENSCQHASHSFTIFQAVNSHTGMSKVHQLFQVLRELQPSHSRVKELGTQLGIM